MKTPIVPKTSKQACQVGRRDKALADKEAPDRLHACMHTKHEFYELQANQS